MSVLVRSATLEDVDALVHFNTAMALETEDRHLKGEILRAGVERVVSTPSLGRCLIATADGEAVGTLSVTQEWSDWRCGFFWWIQSVFVQPEIRGRGVFKALYRTIENEARSDPEVCGLRLYVERENARAQRAYAHLGMQETAYRIYEVEFEAAS